MAAAAAAMLQAEILTQSLPPNKDIAIDSIGGKKKEYHQYCTV